MKKYNSINEEVKNYFDHISEDYGKRYSNQSFHNYFYKERLECSTDGFNFSNKSILDIGAGTGGLYDFLVDNTIDFEYLAVDISKAMMAESNIPESKKRVGDVTQMNFENEKYDFVYLLGLTTYISTKELEYLLENLYNSLRVGGKLIISFSRKRSLETLLRSIYIKLKIKGEKKLASQNFSTVQYSQQEIRKLLNHFEVEEINYLNSTLPIINRLLPKMSFCISKYINRYLGQTFFASDILLKVKKV